MTSQISRTLPAMYFVLADFGAHGRAFIERDPNTADRETTIRDILTAQIDKPLSVLEVDPEEGTCRDVSEDIAREVANRAAANGERLSWHIYAFVSDHTSSSFARSVRPHEAA